MTTAAVVPAQAVLATFEAAAAAAGETETAVRKRAYAEIAAAERERAFAYRRLNLMRTLARAIGGADKEEEAVGRGLAAVRAELGWHDDSETRAETLARLAPVVGAAFASLGPVEDREAPAPDVAGALADFEAWYDHTYGRSFWVLFEQQIEELPLVER
jgi:hypothetical protein